MAGTDMSLNSALVRKVWSNSLDVEIGKTAYFTKYIGGNDAIIVSRTELKKSAGDQITIGLRGRMTVPGVTGDNLIKDTSAEESLNFFNDAIKIDQYRKGTKSKGKMSEQLVPYDIRKEGRDALVTFFAELFDEMLFVYLSGARGVNTGFINPTTWSGFAGNLIQAPDTDHIMYAGGKTKATLTSSDEMSISEIERLRVKIKMMSPKMEPARINGQSKYILLMSPLQSRQLRTSTTTNDWLDIRKNTDGQDSPLYKGSLGEYAGFILHEHENVIMFDDYGAAGNIDAARALCLGKNAGMIAWGGGSGEGRYDWNEEKDDRGNALAITAGTIFGVKKTRYSNGKDYGVVAVDTYIPDPSTI